ncbi:MAG: MaoC family dehydratase [Alphaproteobacteria bacterium]|nr:MaoC family dehydratase [Alphaproteobacteria bacterium]
MSNDDLTGKYFEELEVGMTASLAKTITDADILMFAAVSCDSNPVHTNEEYAKNTMFKGRIAHGMISAGLISAVFGMKLPGPGCIYVSQSLKFRAPVRIGDTLEARVELTELVEAKKFATFRTTAYVGETKVVDGEATLMIPSKNK